MYKWEMVDLQGESIEDLKRRLFQEIDRRKEEIARLCSCIIKVPSENPPGDTTAVASLLRDHLNEIGFKPMWYEPKKGIVNLVAKTKGRERPSLVLNAHMDVFPAGDRKRWDFDPYSGKVSSTKVYGRGAVDMKGGLTASLIAFSLIGALDVELPGTLALTLVSDEEVGGELGTEWLLNNVKDLMWDACIIGEPSGTDCVVYGEKGVNLVTVRVKGLGSAHGTAPFVESAISKAAMIIRVGEELDLKGQIPSVLKPLMESQKQYFSARYGSKVADSVDHVFINVGTIKGGIRPNIISPSCEMEVCIRVPLSVDPEEVVRIWESKVRNYLGKIKASFIFDVKWKASYTDPLESIVRYTTRNVMALLGRKPRQIISLWGSDARLLRRRGIPTVLYGPSPDTMATFNEFIQIRELIQVAKVHTGTALDYLWGLPVAR